MTESAVRLAGPGELKLIGVLDFRSGPQLRKQGAALIKSGDLTELTLDCSEVEKSSSVGLALVLAFMRDARDAGKSLTVRSLRHDMREIARVSGLTELLNIH
ncbi:STAS domain-containing protein [Pseudomonas cannabina pv. alisalensis]|uniref:Sulfate transporter/antisigma-factor antagonist STAS n=2 Tax=Pseudomonas cannabina TaxID=86840 RepID=A0A3M3R9D3_PSECA|nr:STAS domain-containing protein [Pseudomonas cannabina]KPW17551.1 STAS domain-containing protein [Pseudomonas cannabina pv. alisalensis]MBM0138720.1 STAS domain-containing protein [Pseudomonas cannabina pv. alisalensis]RMN82355.1 Sulfate transporter/antisigma-factor antagonist STAS [Pseudomonas cannabina]RMN84909.1 Sulfate transporter/antisigma-factor antagonist STAS [Pseudomonas cannabina pv. alisalensis]RMN92996.1 Sulfate transporter/antisigma-factor antagonist STAS [Pseudomonas cannabina]